MGDYRCSEVSCDRKVIARGLCNSHYRAWHRSLKVYQINCILCGVEVIVSRLDQKFCSRLCSGRYNSVKAREVAALAHAAKREAVAKQRRALVPYARPCVKPRQVVHVRTERRLTSGQCRVCRKWFVDLHMGITCSDECRVVHRASVKRVQKSRRRAVKRNAYVEDVSPRRVFERDGYRCHLCRKKVRTDVVVPHPRAATVDHVIPLASGGTHEMANCRTACFLCNAVKGDRGGGEQLMLVG